MLEALIERTGCVSLIVMDDNDDGWVMKVGELRQIVSGYSQEDLSVLLVELYKSVPKRVKEDKGFDHMIRNIEELKKPKKRAAVKEEFVLEMFEYDLEHFLVPGDAAV